MKKIPKKLLVELPVRRDGSPVPTPIDAYNSFFKQVGKFNEVESKYSSTKWTFNDNLKLVKNETLNGNNICKGIYCDKLQCRNACSRARFIKMENKNKNKNI